jgi:hypothetical protein
MKQDRCDDVYNSAADTQHFDHLKADCLEEFDPTYEGYPKVVIVVAHTSVLRII